MDAWLYVRAPGLYPASDPLQYAADLGCSGVALQPRIRAHREMVAEAVARFGGANVTLYDLPSEYRPSTWRPTLDRAAELAARHGCGILADLEVASEWLASESESRAIGEALSSLAFDHHVGVTSFPAHPRWGFWANIARDAGAPVYGSPQLYGSPGFPRSRYAGEIRDWQDKFPRGCRTSVALGVWSRNDMSPAEYVRYLDDTRDAMVNGGSEERCILWHATPPAPGTVYYDQAKAWIEAEPAPAIREGEGDPSGKRPNLLLAMAVIGVGIAGAAALLTSGCC